VIAYWIAVEAPTNAVRHASAQHVGVRLHVDGALEMAVDDGGGSWQPGVGLMCMRERAAELGASRAVEHRLNDRPRRRLDWRGPAHVMEAELAG
jgi:signal transduction histidine kinase